MKSRSLPLFLIVALLCLTVRPAQAASAYDDYSIESMAGDALVARPLCLALTLVGTALFIVSLPVTLTSGSTKKAADTLVAKPAHLTFTRKLGNFSALNE